MNKFQVDPENTLYLNFQRNEQEWKNSSLQLPEYLHLLHAGHTITQFLFELWVYALVDSHRVKHQAYPQESIHLLILLVDLWQKREI